LSYFALVYAIHSFSKKQEKLKKLKSSNEKVSIDKKVKKKVKKIQVL